MEIVVSAAVSGKQGGGGASAHRKVPAGQHGITHPHGDVPGSVVNRNRPPKGNGKGFQVCRRSRPLDGVKVCDHSGREEGCFGAMGCF